MYTLDAMQMQIPHIIQLPRKEPWVLAYSYRPAHGTID